MSVSLLPLRGFPNPTSSICYITSFLQCFFRAPVDLVRPPMPGCACDQNDAYQALLRIRENMTSDTKLAYSYNVNSQLFERLVRGDMDVTVADDTNAFIRNLVDLLESCTPNFNFELALDLGAVTRVALQNLLDNTSLSSGNPITIIPLSTEMDETPEEKLQRLAEAEAIPLPMVVQSDDTDKSYVLFAFIVHSGQNAMTGGHYVAYINTGLKSGTETWHRFDDGKRVTVVKSLQLTALLSKRVATALYFDTDQLPVPVSVPLVAHNTVQSFLPDAEAPIESFLPPRGVAVDSFSPILPSSSSSSSSGKRKREIIEIEGGAVHRRKRRPSRGSRSVRRRSKSRATPSRPRRRSGAPIKLKNK